MSNECKHCGELTHKESNFCCFGCKFANKLIHELSLEKYYEFCKNIYQSKPMKVYQIDNKLDYIAHIQKEKGINKIYLIVEGIHCGSCVWLIESTLKKQLGVLNARINMSTKRLVLE